MLVWQMRATAHPVAIMATVPKPYSSAPMSARMTSSRSGSRVGAENADGEVILDERPVRLDEAHLEGPARVLDGGEGKAPVRVAAGDLDDVRVHGDRSDCADASLAHELRKP